MTAPRALFAGPGAARALLESRTGVVELIFSGGAYLRFGPDWVLLAKPTAPFGPLSVTVTGAPRFDLHVGAPVEICADRLVVGHTTISLQRMRLRRTGGLARRSKTRAVSDASTAGSALATVPKPPLALRPGINALAAGRIHESVRALAGLGEGLTPAGDDVLAGATAVLSRCNRSQAVRVSTLAAGRASPLGLAYLRCAERGELPDAGARLLSAIDGGLPGSLEAALSAVCTWGASSGTALAWGICAGAIAANALSDDPLRITADARALSASTTEETHDRSTTAASIH